MSKKTTKKCEHKKPPCLECEIEDNKKLRRDIIKKYRRLIKIIKRKLQNDSEISLGGKHCVAISNWVLFRVVIAASKSAYGNWWHWGDADYLPVYFVSFSKMIKYLPTLEKVVNGLGEVYRGHNDELRKLLEDD